MDSDLVTRIGSRIACLNGRSRKFTIRHFIGLTHDARLTRPNEIIAGDSDMCGDVLDGTRILLRIAIHVLNSALPVTAHMVFKKRVMTQYGRLVH